MIELTPLARPYAKALFASANETKNLASDPYYSNLVKEMKSEIDKRWNLDEWQRRHGLISRLVAKEYMKLQSNHKDIDLLSEYEKIYNRISKNS